MKLGSDIVILGREAELLFVVSDHSHIVSSSAWRTVRVYKMATESRSD
jgi:hypothetical protein